MLKMDKNTHNAFGVARELRNSTENIKVSSEYSEQQKKKKGSDDYEKLYSRILGCSETFIAT